MKTQHINFVCPQCGGTDLEITKEVIETYEVSEIDTFEDRSWLVSGDVIDSEVGDTVEVACGSCGHVIAHTQEDAINWLEKEGMIEDAQD